MAKLLVQKAFWNLINSVISESGWLSLTGYWFEVAGYWFEVTGYWLGGRGRIAVPGFW